MTGGRKQHLIDPEICIRCNTCEATCPVGAITHDANNYVVDAAVCNFCMDCVSPCPTGSIDNWFVVQAPFTLQEQFAWLELPPRPTEPAANIERAEALDGEAEELLEDAHRGAGGRARAPASASKPRINLFNRERPAIAAVTGNFRITDADTESDVRHIILDFGTVAFPVLEGQSIGVVPPGTDAQGRPHAMRLYSIASARDGERPNTGNLALTVKRVVEPRGGGGVRGVASNWLCDLPLGSRIEVVGPFGATFLMPDDPDTDILMICTGTGSAPFRGFTERRRRLTQTGRGRLHLYFGARTPGELPYFGPLRKVPASLLAQELVFSRLPGQPKEYVQDRMRVRSRELGALLAKDGLHVYVCGLRGLETGVDAALDEIGTANGVDWPALRDRMRDEGRFHVETY
ncbi:MAG: benzoyl-CoA 2,3-epoxidase subunit BoxA [Acidisphaera sp.]|nr:benzoyl-CoA 2,3-epoxidase subunit BoxA [Acidisphaera sp.]